MPAEMLQELGRRVNETHQGALVSNRGSVDDRVLALRAARTVREQRLRLRARRIRLGSAMAVGSIAAAGMALGTGALRDAPIFAAAFGVRAEIGAWIESPKDRETPVQFSDGTTMALAAEATMRVVATTHRGATVSLDRGRLRADVVHREDSQWNVLAGPFRIHVTGTRFEASWDPETRVLSVRMNEGHVVVSSTCLPNADLSRGDAREFICPPRVDRAAPSTASRVAPRVVAPPPQDVADDGAGALVVAAPAVSPLAAPVVSARSADAPAVQVAVPAEEAGRRVAKKVEPAPPASAIAPSHEVTPSIVFPTEAAWRKAARDGRFAEATRYAESAGFDAICANADAGDLLLLGDAARFAAARSRASTAYRTLRQRFPSDPAAPTAAFHLGRMAMDLGQAEAGSWFEAYRREAPSGPLAREALGRLLEVHERAGGKEPARSTAKSYLELYPDGPHATRAREVLLP